MTYGKFFRFYLKISPIFVHVQIIGTVTLPADIKDRLLAHFFAQSAQPTEAFALAPLQGGSQPGELFRFSGRALRKRSNLVHTFSCSDVQGSAIQTTECDVGGIFGSRMIPRYSPVGRITWTPAFGATRLSVMH
jgi:hypothetical protein